MFDGRRRYDIEMTKVKDVDIRMDNGLYPGKGVQCDVRYHQLAGFRPSVLKANESFPADPCLVRHASQRRGGPRLYRAGAGLGRHQIWRAGGAGHRAQSRRPKPARRQALIVTKA